MRTFIVSMILVVSSFGASESSITGRWQRRAEGKPTVILTLKSDVSGLSGALTSEVIGPDGTVAGVDKMAVIAPKFDGKTLTFRARSSIDGSVAPFRMELITENEAELKLVGRQVAAVRMTREE